MCYREIKSILDDIAVQLGFVVGEAEPVHFVLSILTPDFKQQQGASRAKNHTSSKLAMIVCW